jgi:hypothetical protein
MTDDATAELSALDWLLDGDPSVAWQAQRDLADDASWPLTRERVATEGWGARLLERQDPGGTWGGGLYTPKWTSTTYTLLQLRDIGLAPSDPRAVAGVRRLLDDARWVGGGVSYWATYHQAERCVNGMILALACYFDVGDPRLDGPTGATRTTRRSTRPSRSSRASTSGDAGPAPMWRTRPSPRGRRSSWSTGSSVRTGRAR